MNEQLVLLETPANWRLDQATRERGRRGIEQAREILRAVKQRHEVDDERQAA